MLESDGCPEIELLLASCSGDSGPDASSRLLSAIERTTDWGFFTQIAESHQVAPLAYSAIENAHSGRVPAAVLGKMRAVLTGSQCYGDRLVRELLDVLEVFWGHGIAAFPFKDPLMATAIYGSAGRRHYNDVDILLRKRDRAAARQLLLDRGYEHIRAKGTLVSLLLRCDWLFQTGSPPLVVELHWRAVPVYFCRRLGDWRCVEAVQHDGRVALRLTAEEQLLILCAHEAKHSWFRLKGLCDVAALTRSHPEMDWPHVLSRARQRGIHRIVLVVVYLGHRLFRCELPAAVLEAIVADEQAELLACDLERRFQSPGVPTRPSLYWAHLAHIRSREGVFHRALGALRLSLRVHEKEPACFPVPSTMSALYYATWPIRLFAKYGPLRPLLVQRWRTAE